MFNLQSFSSQKGSVADGATANALNRIRTLLTKLLHSPETGVLFLSNDDGVNIVKGNIVRISNADAASLAVSSMAYEDTRGVAVCLNDVIEPGNKGYFRCAGEVDVKLENGLAPVSSDYIKVGLTPGLGVLSSAVIISPTPRVGLIVDSTEYVTVTNPFVRIVMENCCYPVDIVIPT